MDFISNKQKQRQEMLEEIGAKSVEELFAAIPASLALSPPKEEDGISESEVLSLMESLAKKNTFLQFDSYLGAGAYSHHVPALVGAVCSKSEFLTSYTPYQAEASQGMLQLIFEYQSAICALTGMDVSNASLYDGANACAEASLMALRLNKDRNRILVARTLHPHYRQVVDQCLKNHGTEILEIPSLSNGQLDLQYLTSVLKVNVAAVILQSPNFLGVMEELSPWIQKGKELGILSILCSNPLSYGIYASAGELGVDIAVGDTQPFGLPLQFGGPYAGYITCRQGLVRQIPGRIVGETQDTQGRRGYVLTLQAREQHIRREKANSNICTNQALAALASLTAILWYGKEGVKKLSLTNFQRASYLKHELENIPGITTLRGPIFNEFAISFGGDVERIQYHFRKNGIDPGLPLWPYFPELNTYFLVAVTETKSKEQLDHYVRTACLLYGEGL